MSEEKQPKKPLTPQEHEEAQRKTDGLVQQQAAFVDMTGGVSDLIDIFGPGTGYVALGKTAFDGKQLNELLDMVEPANPADLEHAGDALEKATVAINAAAKDLGDFVKATEWEGEGAAAFRTYGHEVVRYAWDVATLANVVGAQMKVASTGLASVRNAMPPRDDRPADEQKKPHQLSAAERQESNPKYQKAVKVEKDRQEAINQMNRLGSYYAISQSTLASQVLPEPPAAYKAAVPMPTAVKADASTGAFGAAEPGWSRTSSVSPSVDRPEVGTDTGSARPELTGKPADMAGPSTSVQIDSVLAPPAPAPAPAPVAPPSTGPTGPVTGNPLPMPTNFGPVRPTPSRAQGAPGAPRSGGSQGKPTLGRSPVTGTGGPGQTGRTGPAVGRATTPTNGPTSSTGRSTGPTVGRPGMPGAHQATGRPASDGSGPVTGRSAGMPGQTTSGRQGGTSTPRAGHSNGIVGGTPQRATTGSIGSRIPRATVIGAEGSTTGRSTAARPSQSGVVGAVGNNSARPSGRGTPSANGVVGTPRGGVTGTGGVGRSGRRQSRDEGQEQTGSTRPDYLTEDEKTWAGRRQGAVPPVID
ncbi:hypothetical protein [Streptomyces gobitricini]|uniref:Translation initiation factor IF-2 n=1 Tax=Streptomyces gobitricini TaxID=68211 RepID=A0ABN3NA15_9ACTN